MKTLVEVPMGADGGKASVVVAEGMLELKVGYPLEKALAEVKAKFVDKLKALIPGTWDDALIEKAWQDAIKDLQGL